MNKKIAVIIVLILVVALGFVLLVSYAPKSPTAKAGTLDEFAQCVASKGLSMYGAYWCPHCQNEKAAFGDSFKYINYVECTVKTDECTAKGVEQFPTWIFADGTKFVGEQGLSGLAKDTGCVLPDGYGK